MSCPRNHSANIVFNSRKVSVPLPKNASLKTKIKRLKNFFDEKKRKCL